MLTDARKYYTLLSADRVSTSIRAETKHAAIDEVVDLLEGHPSVVNLDEARRAVHEREAVMSTGVGSGLALPHAKTGAVKKTVAAFGISRTGVEFESVDGEPVKLIFLLIGPEAARSEHIKILSWISRILNREVVRSELLAAASPETVTRVIESADRKISA